ncbi:hypothetical protein ABEB36_003495 [Hypothenemus hampei]|uniref:F-box domain-containing protein n=1 Tax=Hypothenemus hampei TaxID=57062 RepID=A0ABD1FA26_HYPHA
MPEFGLLNNPLYAHNILRLVFPYLNQKDRLRCARVCRLWYEVAIHNNVYASMSFCETQFDFEHIFPRMKYYGTKHLTLQSCLHKDQVLNCPILLPRLETIDIGIRCGFIFKIVISVSPYLKEIKAQVFNECCCVQSNGTPVFTGDEPVKPTSTIKTAELLSKNYDKKTEQCFQMSQRFVDLRKLQFINIYNWNPLNLLNINNLETLNLIKFKVPKNLEQILSQCKNLKFLIIVPFSTCDLSDAILSNQIIFNCVQRLGPTLELFTWGFSEEYLETIREFYILKFSSLYYNMEWIPVSLDGLQTCPKHAPFVQMKMLEQHLKQQNWPASVNVCKVYI